MIVALATALSFGTCALVPTEWTVTYADGIVETYSTADNRLDLQARPGLRFSIVQCQQSVCSQSQEFVADPVPGDADWDGCIGIEDFLQLGDRFGECIQ